MKVRIDRTRMAMPEPAYAYDVNVPTTEVDRSKHNYFIIRDGKEYVSFENATRPAELNAMEIGWARYEASMAHEEACKPKMLELARQAFPELNQADHWPTLWLVIPNLDATHATVYTEV